MTSREQGESGNGAAWAILALILVYGTALYYGLPQRWTAQVVAAHAEHAGAAVGGHGVEHVAGHAASAAAASTAVVESAVESASLGSAAPHGSNHGTENAPPLWTIAPFVALLGADRHVSLAAPDRALVGEQHQSFQSGSRPGSSDAVLLRVSAQGAHRSALAGTRRNSCHRWCVSIGVRTSDPRQRAAGGIHSVYRAAVQPLHDRRRRFGSKATCKPIR